jgi:hypothetical protein
VRPPPGWDVGEGAGAGESEDTGVGMGKGVGVGEDKGAGMVERHTHIMLLFYVIHFVTIINTIFVHLDGWLVVCGIHVELCWLFSDYRKWDPGTLLLHSLCTTTRCYPNTILSNYVAYVLYQLLS